MLPHTRSARAEDGRTGAFTSDDVAERQTAPVLTLRTFALNLPSRPGIQPPERLRLA